MNIDTSSTPAPRAHRGASSLFPFRRHALALGTVAVVIGNVWHVAALAQLAQQQPVEATMPASASASQLNRARPDASAAAAQREQAGDDDQDAEDAPPPEPQLEAIPVVPAEDPGLLDVSGPRPAASRPLPRTAAA